MQREHAAVGFFLSGHPLDDYQAALSRMRVQRFSEFSAAVRATGVSMGRVAASVIDRTERRTRTGNKMGIVQLSDQSGHFEAVLFAEGLQKFRELLEPGRAVVLRLSAALDGEDVRARIEDAEPLDQAVARQRQDMRVFLKEERAIPLLGNRIKDRGESRVSMILVLEDGAREVEVELPGRFAVTPALASAMRSLPGVLDVELA